MNTNENIRNETSEEVIELGVVSTDTKGGPLTGEDIGGPHASGIAEE